MKQFKWKLDTSFANEEIKVTPSQLFLSYLNGALTSAYKDGIGRDYLRRAFKISEKVEASTTDTIELEDAEFELIKEAFERAKFNPAIAKVVVQIYDAIDNAK